MGVSLMPSQWFRVGRTGNGSGFHPYRPAIDEYRDRIDAAPACRLGDQGQGQNGGKGQGQQFMVRVYAEQDVLDEIAADPNITAFPDAPTQALNQAFGQSRGSEDWETAISYARGTGVTDNETTDNNNA